MNESQTLIPGLPNDIASTILSIVPYCHHARIKPTCKSWKHHLSSKPFVSSLQSRNHFLCIFPHDPSMVNLLLFDPNNLAWTQLPRMPSNPNGFGLSNFSAINLGPHLYVLGGTLYDRESTSYRSTSSTSSVFRFNLHDLTWESMSPMLSPRGSFACAATGGRGMIVAGGGSRYLINYAEGGGTCIRSAERYDVEGDKWEAVEALPGVRADCIGFVVGGEKEEFWVMGGYSGSRTIVEPFLVDEYCRDAVVMELKDGGGGGVWREVGDMWLDGERKRIGKVVVAEDEGHGCPGVFMIDGNEIFRYDMTSNRWLYESCVPQNTSYNPQFSFVAVDRELYVLAQYFDLTETWSTHHKRDGTIYIPIYNPKKKTWRSLVTKCPFDYTTNHSVAVLSSICLSTTS